MGIVRGDDREPHLLAQLEDLGVELGLSFRVVGLDLQVVAVPEEVGVPVGGCTGPLPVVGHEVPGHLPRHAGGADDDAAGMRRQDLPVHPRPVIEALRVPDGRELHEVLVALHVPGQQDQMVVGPFSLAGLRAVPAIPGSHVGLHPDNGLEPCLAGQLVECPGAEEAAVVRKGQAGHLEFLCPVNEVGEAVGSVEEGVLGVCMEVDEAHSARFTQSG